jgi:hypothetical protein
MTYSKKNQKQKPEIIRVSIADLAPDPIPGYTPQDFWNDLDTGNAEFERFQALAKGLLNVSKDEIDERRSA